MILEQNPPAAGWNPWHGCTKISEGCRHCYVYRQDASIGVETPSSLCRKTASLDLPIRKKRDGSYRIAPGSLVSTCFTSDFLLRDADEWRPLCWEIMRARSDCFFLFFTKRIDRLADCLPPDWGEGYENVMIGCTTENQKEADRRLPVFRALPIRYRMIVAAPLLERLDLTPYLDEKIREVSVGGESGTQARVCDYDWVLSLREQCRAAGVDFCFHQTGARFRKDGKLYRIPRAQQRPQARRANIDLGACGPGPQNTSKEIL